jgi:hypothetical protein
MAKVMGRATAKEKDLAEPQRFGRMQGHEAGAGKSRRH